MERDRLKAKLAALREDHKRKVMAKIIGRLGNMKYFLAWNQWHTATIKFAQKQVEMRIRELKAQLKECKDKTASLEAEAQRRADEAAALAFGAATDSQKKLVWKILVKLSQLKTRLAWAMWFKQAFAAKHQKMLMIKILKRLKNGFLNRGFSGWKMITQKWHLITKLELKEKLIAELAELEKLAKQYKEDAEKRQEDAAAAAFARATGGQKDLMIKILSKLTGNLAMMSFKIWQRKAKEFDDQYKLLTKIMGRMVNIKKYSAYRHWHNVVFLSGLSKHKMREALLESQRDNLASTLKERAAELKRLQEEAMSLLQMSQQNAAATASVMQCSDHFADQLHLILDPKALEKRNALSPEQLEQMIEQGVDPSTFQAPPFDPTPPPNPYANYGAPRAATSSDGVPGLPFDAPPPRSYGGGGGGGGGGGPAFSVAASGTAPPSPDLEGFQPLPPGDYYYRPTSPTH